MPAGRLERLVPVGMPQYVHANDDELVTLIACSRLERFAATAIRRSSCSMSLHGESVATESQ